MSDPDELIALFGKITTSDHDQLQEQFSRIMRVEPNVANFYLEASAWNVEVAVHNYLASSGSGDPAPCASPPEAAFVGDLSELQATTFQPGVEVKVELRFMNTGSQPWPFDARLAFVDGPLELQTSPIPLACGPGQESAAILTIRTPQTPGSHAATWRLVCSAGYFGTPVWIIINVGNIQGQVEQQFGSSNGMMMAPPGGMDQGMGSLGNFGNSNVAPMQSDVGMGLQSGEENTDMDL